RRGGDGENAEREARHRWQPVLRRNDRRRPAAARLRTARQGHEGAWRGAGHRPARRSGRPARHAEPDGRDAEGHAEPVMTAVFDVDEQQFMDRVVERSREVPVVVDFWADWCGPCKALSPALESAANSRAGKVELAKVDVDKNQMLAQSFGVRGIP